MMTGSRRVFIADDHALFRKGVRALVSLEPDLIVAGEAGTLKEAMRHLRAEPYDILVLDLSLPDGSGMDLIRQIRPHAPSLPILILSSHPEEHYAINLLRAGANGYVMKGAGTQDVMQAIRTVLQGKKYVSEAIADMLIADTSQERPPHEHLTEREFQVFCKLAAGQSVGAIAAELFLSNKTVSTYRARVMTKMAARSNVDLTHYAVKNGLVQ